MTKNSNDSLEDDFSALNDSHFKLHSPNAFCGNAGPEEMKHFQDLLDPLSHIQIAALVDAVGIHFASSTKDIDRDTLEGVLDEADREDFYREYRKLFSNK